MSEPRDRCCLVVGDGTPCPSGFVGPVRAKRSRCSCRCRAVGCRTKTRWLYDVGVGALVHLCDDHRAVVPPLKPHTPPGT